MPALVKMRNRFLDGWHKNFIPVPDNSDGPLQRHKMFPIVRETARTYLHLRGLGERFAIGACCENVKNGPLSNA